MKRQKRYDKKNFKRKLTSIMLIYMDGLNKKKNEKLNKYLSDKLDTVVNYYVRLLKKKELKPINVIEKAGKNEMVCTGVEEMTNEVSLASKQIIEQ